MLNAVKTRLLFLALVVLGTAMFVAFQAKDAQAQNAGKVEVCHVTDPDAVPFAAGHVIEINRNACEAHCTNHGDHALIDGACAAAFPSFGTDDCIVNSNDPDCSVDRCIVFCEAQSCGNCVEAHGGIGCDNAECEAAICAIDPFCCNVAWDGICQAEALDICVPDICIALLVLE